MSATLARSVAPFAARMDSNALPNKLSALVRRTGRQAVSTSNASVGPDDEYCEECLLRVRPDWEYCPYCGCDLPSGGDDVATGRLQRRPHRWEGHSRSRGSTPSRVGRVRGTLRSTHRRDLRLRLK